MADVAPQVRAGSSPTSKRRRLVFRLVCVCSPFVLLALAEFILLLYGFGGYPPILRKVGAVEGGRLVLADQAGAISWFFANPDRPGYNDQYSFLDPKPSNTFRIF